VRQVGQLPRITDTQFYGRWKILKRCLTDQHLAL